MEQFELEAAAGGAAAVHVAIVVEVEQMDSH